MAKKIELKATGETITFTKTSVETNGQFTEVLATLNANGEGPPTHRHVFQICKSQNLIPHERKHESIVFYGQQQNDLDPAILSTTAVEK